MFNIFTKDIWTISPKTQHGLLMVSRLNKHPPLVVNELLHKHILFILSSLILQCVYTRWPNYEYKYIYLYLYTHTHIYKPATLSEADWERSCIRILSIITFIYIYNHVIWLRYRFVLQSPADKDKQTNKDQNQTAQRRYQISLNRFHFRTAVLVQQDPDTAKRNSSITFVIHACTFTAVKRLHGLCGKELLGIILAELHLNRCNRRRNTCWVSAQVCRKVCFPTDTIPRWQCEYWNNGENTGEEE